MVGHLTIFKFHLFPTQIGKNYKIYTGNSILLLKNITKILTCIKDVNSCSIKFLCLVFFKINNLIFPGSKYKTYDKTKYNLLQFYLVLSYFKVSFKNLALNNANILTFDFIIIFVQVFHVCPVFKPQPLCKKRFKLLLNI